MAKTENNKGVIVTKINNEESNLILGDIITEINREIISDPKSFKSLVDTIQITGRSSLMLRIIRDEESFFIAVKFKDN